MFISCNEGRQNILYTSSMCNISASILDPFMFLKVISIPFYINSFLYLFIIIFLYFFHPSLYFPSLLSLFISILPCIQNPQFVFLYFFTLIMVYLVLQGAIVVEALSFPSDFYFCLNQNLQKSFSSQLPQGYLQNLAVYKLTFMFPASWK